MCKLRTYDFYYGSVISMLNNSGITPTLIETQEDNRRIYEISTNGTENTASSIYS